MKKFILTAVLSVSVSAVCAAKTFPVITNGEVAQDVETNGWWNGEWATVEVNSEKVFQFTIADKAPGAGSMGFLNTEKWSAGPLNSAKLNIEWSYEGSAPATYIIRVTANQATPEGANVEEDFTLPAPEAEGWTTTVIDVATDYPAVAQAWKDALGSGKAFVFSIVAENCSPDSKINFRNVYYTDLDESWEAPVEVELPSPTTVPVPEYEAADVVSIFGAKYEPATSFYLPNWGQATESELIEIDGVKVLRMKDFNYQGLEYTPHVDATKCNYMHVDMWTPDGDTFGFTPISPGQEAPYIASVVNKEEWNSYDVKLSHWNNVDFADIFQTKFDQGNGQHTYYVTNVLFYYKEEVVVPPTPGSGEVYVGSEQGSVSQTMNEETKEYPYELKYSITYNEDNTLTVKADFVWANGEPVGLVAGTVYVDNVPTDFTMEDGIREATTTATYDMGQSVHVRFFLPMALGIVEKEITYEVGSTNPLTAISEIETSNAPVEYYTLQGVRVANPGRGLYIRVQDGKAQKMIF